MIHPQSIYRFVRQFLSVLFDISHANNKGLWKSRTCSSKQLISFSFVGQNGHNPFKTALLQYIADLQNDFTHSRSSEIRKSKIQYKKMFKISLKKQYHMLYLNTIAFDILYFIFHQNCD